VWERTQGSEERASRDGAEASRNIDPDELRAEAPDDATEITARDHHSP
jgi:hypothetical protein